MRRLFIGEKEVSSVSIRPGISEPEKYAAAELEKYLTKIGIPVSEDGAEIRIGLDKSIGRDGYAIEPCGGSLSINGGNGRGVIYGVYAFLERYAGVRYFTPTLETLGEGDIRVSEGVRFTPVFEMRKSDWVCGRDVAWCLKQGINDYAKIPREKGGYIKYGGPACHTFGYFLGIPQGEQPCLSDPEVLKKIIAGVRKLLEEDPEISIVSVTQNDCGNYCTCEKCAAVDAEEGGPSGSVMRFVNAVAADIAKDYPDVVIQTFAYWYSEKPPRITKPLPNVSVQLCRSGCFSHRLNDPACPINREFARELLDWNRLCDRLYIWDYVTDFKHYVCPYPNFTQLHANMRFFADHGVRGIYPEGNYQQGQSGEFGELRCYLLAKLMMDPLMSTPEYYRHMDEFLAAYYGAGWRNIRAYIDWCCVEVESGHSGRADDPFDYIPRDRWEAMEDTITGWWDKAEEAAGERLEAVRRSRIQWRWLQQWLHPDPEEAKKLTEDIRAARVQWCEWRILRDDPDYSLDPYEWGIDKNKYAGKPYYE
jgi:hypothetical protein